jgi:hypothetical protein
MMSGTTESGSAAEEQSAMHSVAAAMRDAAATASEDAAQVKQLVGEIGPKALDSLSRVTYTGSYVLAYGIVYAAVFIAQSMPQENPVVNGFRDGGRAALEELLGR